MARKYICDNCKKEFDDPDAIDNVIGWMVDYDFISPMELCDICADKLEKIMKDGWK
jgi:hypothetical protein